jgi:signal peptidase I
MEPTIAEGDSMAVTPVGGEYMAVGDSIVYRSPLPSDNGEYPLIAHRIVEITDEILHTKGDNRTAMDPFEIPPTRVQGKVLFIIPREGVKDDASSFP